MSSVAGHLPNGSNAPPDTIGLNRRNGKQRSCEPCRKVKTRCDHRIPVCRRCQVKGIAHECFYHPAPLTQSRPLHHSSSQSPSRHQPHNALAARNTTSTATATSAFVTTPAFAGLVATSAVLSSPSPGLETNPHSAFSDQPSSFEPSQVKQTNPVDELQVADVLSCLSELDFISKLFKRWYEVSEVRILPTQFALEAISSLHPTATSLSASPSIHSQTATTAARVLQTTLQSLVIPPDTAAADFTRLLTGPSLRLETLGLLFATAGLAALKLPNTEFIFIHHAPSKTERKAFASKMSSASETCLAICDRYFIVNDVTVWLRADNLTLTSLVYGNTSPQAWHVSGLLFNDIVALNLHRQPDEASRGPLFLEEIRSRVFAAAYRTDKAMSTACGKPPRLPRHYCGRRQPLHLRDDELTGSEEDIRAAIEALDEDGWSQRENLHSTTWLRSRFVLSTFREEMLRVELGFGDSVHDEDMLRGISCGVHEAWNRFPRYMRYDHGCWDSNPSPNICFMLLVVYLEYLDIVFLVERLLYIRVHASNSQGDDSALLTAAALVLSTTVTSSRHLSRSSGAYIDYVWVLMFYGLPSATVLALALKKSANLGARALHPLSWPGMYRQLSALAADLEGIVETSDYSHSPMKRGSKFLVDTLDEALNARMTTNATATAAIPSVTVSVPPQEPAQPSISMPSFSSSLPAESFDFLSMDEGAFGEAMNCLDASDIAALDFASFGRGDIWGA
ncbi:hypothetical protein B0T22DRAFT_140580 [Podospora appendiculata]|uniref:Zn(2)-C6 fungal-type domain-containing protein n=1 Tax=Podospora appendiculata TaxID=314037 RepID=A0AAE1CBX6_9PEZI|nr:hypothetical protein B0T22DRAFT_140580 [Podospora appendiculata]